MGDNGIVVKISAPGKVILHGEHSVVYGKLAIAASLDLRTSVTVEERQKNGVEINFIDLNYKHCFNITDNLKIPCKSEENFSFNTPELIDHLEFIETIKSVLNLDETLDKSIYFSVLSLFYLYFGIVYSKNCKIIPLSVTVQTNLRLGSGTGSSASLMVSLASAFLHFVQIKDGKHEKKHKFTDQELNLISKWSFSAEKIIHGNPSGIDNTVCTYGFMVSFRKGRTPFAVQTATDIQGILIDTKVPKNTAVMVKTVADLRKKKQKIVDAIMVAMDELADEALEILVRLRELKEEEEIDECYKELGNLSTLNHNLLRCLNVSHPSLDATVDTLNQHGFNGKLTGAGGGGYALAILPPSTLNNEQLDKVCLSLEKLGYVPVITKLGGEGVRIE